MKLQNPVPTPESLQREERILIAIFVVGAVLIVPIVLLLALFALRLLGGLVFLAYAVYAIHKTTTPMPN